MLLSHPTPPSAGCHQLMHDLQPVRRQKMKRCCTGSHGAAAGFGGGQTPKVFGQRCITGKAPGGRRRFSKLERLLADQPRDEPPLHLVNLHITWAPTRPASAHSNVCCHATSLVTNLINSCLWPSSTVFEVFNRLHALVTLSWCPHQVWSISPLLTP